MRNRNDTREPEKAREEGTLTMETENRHDRIGHDRRRNVGYNAKSSDSVWQKGLSNAFIAVKRHVVHVPDWDTHFS
jgi:hypothetical protein